MAKKSKRQKAQVGQCGLRAVNVCNYPDHVGDLYLWDLSAADQWGPGPDGERWVVEWHPGGRRKGRHIYLPSLKIAKACFAQLRRGGEDLWGLFVDFSSPVKPDVSSGQLATTPGGAPPATPGNLTAALIEQYTPEVIIGHIDKLLTARKPIYGSENGTQKVVAWEPDVVAVSNGLKILLSYRDGTPVKRTEEIKRHEASAADIISSIETKPGYRHALMGLIQAVEERQSKRLADLARSVPVEVIDPEEEEHEHPR
jgi:hypothetical protein